MKSAIYDELIPGTKVDAINEQNGIGGSVVVKGLTPYSTIVLVFCLDPASIQNRLLQFAVRTATSETVNMASIPSSSNRMLRHHLVPFVTSVPPAQPANQTYSLSLANDQPVTGFRLFTKDISQLKLDWLVGAGMALDGIFISKFST